jgi:hypothetical protein
MRKKLGWILAAAWALSCRKDACDGVVCESGYNCDGGRCVCTAGTAQNILIAGGSADQSALAVVSEPSGNILYFGQGTGKALFGNDSIVIPEGSGVYCAAVGLNDSVLWTRYLAPVSHLKFAGALAAGDKILLYGSWREAGTLGGRTLTAWDGTDGVLAKMDAAGNVENVMLFGGRGHQSFTGAYQDAQGNVYLVGTFSDTLWHEAGAAAGFGGRDAFVMALNRDWEFRWLRTFGGAGDDEPAAVFQDSDGDVHVWSTVTGDSVRFLAGDSMYVYSGLGKTDVAWAVYERTGKFKRATVSGGAGTDRAGAAAIGFDGLYLGGSFQASAAFGSATVTSAPAGAVGVRASDTTFFIAKADFSGRFRWAVSAPGELRALAFAPTGRLYAAGTFYGVTNVGGFSLTAADPGLGEIFLVVLDGKGLALDAQRGGGPGADGARSIAFGADGAPRLAADAYNVRVHDPGGSPVFNNADFGSRTLVAPFPNRRFAFLARLCRTL